MRVTAEDDWIRSEKCETKDNTMNGIDRQCKGNIKGKSDNKDKLREVVCV